MMIHYLNLDRRTDRNLDFLARNQHIDCFRRVAAKDGSQLSRQDLTNSRIIQPDLRNFSTGALGNAASHHSLWHRCIADGYPITAAEDDAVFNIHFTDAASDILDRLPSDWDIIHWGWNFDSILHISLFNGPNESVMHFQRPSLGADLRSFQNAVYDSVPLRLLHCFGLVCYSISPRGAARLLKRCFPLRNETIFIPGLKTQVCNITLDTAMNAHFRALNAYVCFPPLVWTENDRSQSDVRIEQ